MDKVVKPLGKQVLVECITANKTEGGIHLPDSAKQEKGNRVLAVGDECRKVKKGNIIVFNSTKVALLKMPGVPENWFLIPEEDILATIENK